MDAEQLRETARGLRAALAEIDAGRVEATPAERAYIAGALDALDRLTDPADDHPRT